MQIFTRHIFQSPDNAIRFQCLCTSLVLTLRIVTLRVLTHKTSKADERRYRRLSGVGQISYGALASPPLNWDV